MRKVFTLHSTSVVALIAPYISAGLPSVLAGVNMHKLDSKFHHTTNLMHAGYCQFMRVHEGS